MAAARVLEPAENPLALLFGMPRQAAPSGVLVGDALRNHLALEDCVRVLGLLLSGARMADGSKYYEIHEDVDVNTADTTIKHQLGRRPFGALPLRSTAARGWGWRYEQCDDTTIVLFTVTATQQITFLLF